MIYAFLGVARIDCGITVDYSQTYGQILVHAAQRIIQTDKNLALLIEVTVRKFTNSGAIGVYRYPRSDDWQIRQRLKAVQNLPSWVPDWSIPPTNEAALHFLGHPFSMEVDWGMKPLPDAWTQSGQDFEPKFLHVGPGLPVCGLKIGGELICTLERFADDSTFNLFSATRWKGLVEGSHALEENYITVESTAEATTRDQVWKLDGFALHAILRLFDHPSHDLYEFVSLANLNRSRLGSTSTNGIEPKRNVGAAVLIPTQQH